MQSTPAWRVVDLFFPFEDLRRAQRRSLNHVDDGGVAGTTERLDLRREHAVVDDLRRIVALSMFVQAVVVIVAAIGATKTQKRVLLIAEELRARATPLIDKAIPIIDKAETLVEVTLPKIQTISNNLVETSEIVKAKAKEFDVTLTDVNLKTRAQVARVDGMVSSALTATGALAEMVHKGIRTPLVEVSGLVNGLKAGIDVLFSKSKPKSMAVTKYEE